jgi:S-phase kinase-associated protein 1
MSHIESLSLEDPSVNETQLIGLVTGSGTRFELTRKQASLSKFIETALCDDSEKIDIPMSQKYNDEDVSKMIEFLIHHNGEAPEIPEQPLRSKKMSEVTTEWCATFVDEIGKNRDLLYKVIDLANYFDIQSLLHICCAKVASLIKGEKLENIKNILTTNELNESA